MPRDRPRGIVCRLDWRSAGTGAGDARRSQDREKIRGRTTAPAKSPEPKTLTKGEANLFLTISTAGEALANRPKTDEGRSPSIDVQGQDCHRARQLFRPDGSRTPANWTFARLAEKRPATRTRSSRSRTAALACPSSAVRSLGSNPAQPRTSTTRQPSTTNPISELGQCRRRERLRRLQRRHTPQPALFRRGPPAAKGVRANACRKLEPS